MTEGGHEEIVYAQIDSKKYTCGMYTSKKRAYGAQYIDDDRVLSYLNVSLYVCLLCRKTLLLYKSLCNRTKKEWKGEDGEEGIRLSVILAPYSLLGIDSLPFPFGYPCIYNPYMHLLTILMLPGQCVGWF